MNEDRNNKLKGFVWLLLTAAVGFGFAFGLNSLIALVPWSLETALSRVFSVNESMVACRGPADSAALLKKIESRLRLPDRNESSFPFDIAVVSDDSVNAFASLGGHIFIHKGLIKQAVSPEQLAGVLAHEIEHVKRRHILQGALIKMIFSSWADSQLMSVLMNLHFSRTQEQEADEGGLQRLNAAGIDTKGFQEFFERMQTSASVPAFLSDHPSDESRATLAQKYKTAKPTPIMTHDEWLRLQNFCGAL